MSKIITSCFLNGLEYRLVGGQPNKTQISLQARKLDRPFFNKDKFKVIQHGLRIVKKNGDFCLTTTRDYTYTPKPCNWPEGFLEDHYNKLSLKIGEKM